MKVEFDPGNPGSFMEHPIFVFLFVALGSVLRVYRPTKIQCTMWQRPIGRCEGRCPQKQLYKSKISGKGDVGHTLIFHKASPKTQYLALTSLINLGTNVQGVDLPH